MIEHKLVEDILDNLERRGFEFAVVDNVIWCSGDLMPLEEMTLILVADELVEILRKRKRPNLKLVVNK